MSAIDMLGVLNDGTAPAADVQDESTTLRVQIGEDVTVRLRLVGRNGVPVRLAAGDAIVMVARKRPSPFSKLLFRVTGSRVPAEGADRADLLILGTATRALDPQAAVYDVWYTPSGGTARVVKRISPLVLDGSVRAA